MKSVASRTDRRGTVLLQVTFLVIVLMGLLALVIDMGIARATQTFMQAGADAASLEGVRFRDAETDAERRDRASVTASLVFDEDLDLDTAAEALLLGAGPQLDTGVAGVDAPAGGLLVDLGPYLPVLQTNAVENLAQGDMVAGTFTAVDPLDAGNPDWHAESYDYVRTDFSPAGATEVADANAFLVRMRRTNNVSGLDEVDGVSSRGETLPFLFGLGSGVLTTEDADVYDPRRDGITVRATSIADARPVVAAGIMGPLVNGIATLGTDVLDPATPRIFGLEDASWRIELAVGAPFTLHVRADGTVVGDPNGTTPGVVGYALQSARPVRVGDVAANVAVANSLVLPIEPPGIEGVRYLALYSGDRVIGFGAVQITSAVPGVDDDGNDVLVVSGQKLASLIAPENASAVPSLATDLTVRLPAAAEREPLLAPVLAR